MSNGFKYVSKAELHWKMSNKLLAEIMKKVLLCIISIEDHQWIQYIDSIHIKSPTQTIRIFKNTNFVKKCLPALINSGTSDTTRTKTLIAYYILTNGFVHPWKNHSWQNMVRIAEMDTSFIIRISSCCNCLLEVGQREQQQKQRDFLI